MANSSVLGKDVIESFVLSRDRVVHEFRDAGWDIARTNV